MRKWIGVMAILLLATAIRAGNENPETLIKEYLKNTKDAIHILSAIKNQKTAEAAKPKLNALSKRLLDVEKKRQVLDKTSAKTLEAVQKKYDKQLQALEGDLSKEFLRLEKLPATWAALETTPFGPPILGRRDEARERVVQLTEAVQTYKANYKEYPASLDALAKKRGKDDALVDEKALMDPWGRPYQYDVKGPRNGGLAPDLWSQGALPGDPASIIGNWQSAGKKIDPKKK